MSEMELLPSLSQEEIAQIESEIEHLPNRSSAAIEALFIVQKQRGWISDESLHAIAGLLEMPSEDLEGVATFYNLIYRQPVGRHVVMVCDSVSCFVMGADELARQVQAVLGINFGETTSDNRFTLLPIVCLGACDKAPVMMIDQDLIANASTERLEEFFGAYD